MTLLKLAEQCEAAAGPDRELGEAISELLEPGLFCRDGRGLLRKNLHGTALTPQWDLWNAPRYTASLDAAMTLVPEGWQFRRLEWNSAGITTATLKRIIRQADPAEYAVAEDCATPALALCAAALRARAKMATVTGDAPDIETAEPKAEAE